MGRDIDAVGLAKTARERDDGWDGGCQYDGTTDRGQSRGALTVLVTAVAVLGNTARQLGNEILVTADALVIELLAALEVVAETVLLSLCQ